jgi:hypothetical protein
MSGMADGLTITPTTQKHSKFEVAENQDSVMVAARQGNVAVSDGQQTSTTEEGQETEHKRKKEGGAVTAASGHHAISKWTLAILGVGVAVGGAAIAIEATEPGTKCISSSGAKKCKCKKDKNGKEDCREDD